MRKLIGWLAPACLLWAPGGAPAANVELEVIGPDGRGVGDIAVYLVAAGSGAGRTGAAGEIRIRQRDRAFRPHISIVEVGATVIFTNDDDITHHVYSVGGPYRFSHTIRAGSQTPPIALGRPGLIAMGCNIHDWMSGYLKIVPTPWFALTDDAGRASIAVAAKSPLRAVAWHPHFDGDPPIDARVAADAPTVLRLPRVPPPAAPQKSVDEFDFLEEY